MMIVTFIIVKNNVIINVIKLLLLGFTPSRVPQVDAASIRNRTPFENFQLVVIYESCKKVHQK